MSVKTDAKNLSETTLQVKGECHCKTMMIFFSSVCDKSHAYHGWVNERCCSITNLCGENEGNCHSDSECLANLECGSDKRCAPRASEAEPENLSKLK